MDLSSVPIVNEGPKTLDGTIVPTADEDVRKMLRKLQQPVTYFGEDKADRRNRLIKLINEQQHQNFGDGFEVEAGGDYGGQLEDSEEEEDLEDDEEFYTPGPEELLDTRKSILYLSLARARKRIRDQQQEYESNFIQVLKHRRIINLKMAQLELFGTQLIPHNTRSIGSVKYSPSDALVACGSWNGNFYVLDNQLSLVFQLTPGYHQEKVNGLDWVTDDLLLTGGNEGTVNFWTFPETKEDKVGGTLKPQFTVKAHDGRVTKTLLHTNKQSFITTSFDQTWKLWDFNKQTELLQQEGHLKEIFSGSLHPDGSILSTGGLDAIAKLWDLRSGKLMMNLTSHIQGIYCMDWSPNGYHLATGSGDCSIKIWDIRKLDNRFGGSSNNNDNENYNGELVSIPGHTKLVSDLKFYNQNNKNTKTTLSEPVTDENDNNSTVLSSNGKILMSSSYDGEVNFWSADNWIKVGQLASQEKVMSCDISGDGASVVTSHWDKSVKLWTK